MNGKISIEQTKFALLQELHNRIYKVIVQINNLITFGELVSYMSSETAQYLDIFMSYVTYSVINFPFCNCLKRK